ncbi:hypothetical protein Bca101_086611 [Brassica carinata]
MSSSTFVFLFLFSFLTSFGTFAQDPRFVHLICPNTTTFSRNSTYLANLRTLLSSLSSPNASYATGSQSATVGQPPDRVTGLYLCRGDVTPEVCRRCVAFAVNERGDALLRRQPPWHPTVPGNPTDFQTLNGLVQCTPDLTSQDCLDRIINQLPTDRIGGRVMVPSCFSRFELYLFYNEAAADRTPQPQLHSAPPPPPPISIPSPRPGDGGNSTVIAIAVVVPITVIFLLLVAVLIFRAKRKTTAYETEPLAGKGSTSPVISYFLNGDDIATAGSLQFDFKAIEAATGKFSQENKLGQGGFGQVYKGTFPSGVQVAVKRLSNTSGQGKREFENEVVVVAKLQHRNLVRLLGFCLEGEEKILIYEFVHNKSLDYFLFGQMSSILA